MRTFFLLFISSLAWAQTTGFRYEGKLQGPNITSGTMNNQTLSVRIQRPDACGTNLGLTTWSSSSVNLQDGAFSINPNFTASTFAQAMNPWNDFGAGCTTPEFRRNMILTWGSETFTIPLEDSPRANFANYAASSLNTSSIGTVAVQSPLACTSGSILKFISANNRFECATLVNTDIPTLAATHIPSLGGDLSGTISSVTVNKIKGIAISSTAPTTNQILKYNGTSWAPSNESTLPDLITSGGPIGSATTTPVITYDSKGRLTAVSTATISDPTKLSLSGGTLTGDLNFIDKNIIGVQNLSSSNADFKTMTLANTSLKKVTLKIPSTLATSYTLNLPLTTGTAGQLLTTDGSGILSWSSAGDVSNGGNTFGSTMNIGTNDSQNLAFETNGSSRVTITSDGKMGIGTTTPAALLHTQQSLTTTSSSYTYGLQNALQFTPSANHSGFIIGSANQIELPTSSFNVGNAIGSSIRNIASTASTISTATGLDVETSRVAAGTTTTTNGILSSVKNSFGTSANANGLTSTVTNSDNGALTSAYGVKSLVKNGTNSTITNVYGIYTEIENTNTTTTPSGAVGLGINFTGTYSSATGIRIQSAATTSSYYPIYQMGTNGINYFDGKIGLATLAPQAKLDVNGSIRVGQGSVINKIVICSNISFSNQTLISLGGGSEIMTGSCPDVTTGMVISCSVESESLSYVSYVPMKVTTDGTLRVKVVNFSGGNNITIGSLSAVLSCTGTR